MTYRERYPLEQFTPRCPSQKRYNTFDLSGEYGIGYTRKGERYLFDLEDYEYIKNYNWKLNPSGYLICQIKRQGKMHIVALHRILVDAPDGMNVDHINGDKLDNRKTNLRFVTYAQNNRNRPLSRHNKTGVTGVFWHKKLGKWLVNISVNYKSIYIGIFDKFEDAVKARYEAEDKYYGEYSASKSRNMRIGE